MEGSLSIFKPHLNNLVEWDEKKDNTFLIM